MEIAKSLEEGERARSIGTAAHGRGATSSPLRLSVLAGLAG